jgi:hypothetical protein
MPSSLRCIPFLLALACSPLQGEAFAEFMASHSLTGFTTF